MKLFFNRALRVMLTANVIILFAGAMVGPIYAFFVEEVGGDLLDASFAAGVFALAAGIAVLITGRFSDKVKESELILVLGYALVGLGFFLYIFVDSIGFLLVAQAIIGLGEAIWAAPFDNIYSKHLDGHKSGFQWAVWEASDYFTRTFGAIAGGFIVTFFGFDVLFGIMTLLCFSSAVFIFFLPRKVL